MNGLLVLSHLCKWNLGVENIIVMQADILLIIQAKCLVVTVYDHHAKDLNWVSVCGEHDEDLDESCRFEEDCVLGSCVVFGQLLVDGLDAFFSLLVGLGVEKIVDEGGKVVEVNGFLGFREVLLEFEFPFRVEVSIELFPADLFSELVPFVGDDRILLLGLVREHRVHNKWKWLV